MKKKIHYNCNAKKGRHLLAKYTVTQKVETAPSTRAGN
jgi:hypothetical protein